VLALVWSGAALIVVFGALLLLRVLGWGGRWAGRLAHSDVLTFLTIVVGVFALYVSVGTTIEARQGGEAQQRALESVLRTLESERRAVENSAATLENQAEALRRLDERSKVQVDIVAAQEARTLAELKRRPRLQLTAGGVAMNPAGGVLLPTIEETPTRTVVHLTLKNVGNGTLHHMTWRGYAFAAPDSGITLRCPGCAFTFENGRATARFVLLELEALRAGNGIEIPLTVEYPANAESFDVQFNADGENLLPQDLGSFRITPSRTAAPNRAETNR